MSDVSTPMPDPAAPGPVETPKGKAGLVSIAVIISRILGLIREVALAGFFGGSKWMDCFNVAFRTPNMLRDMFAEGALSAAFVTTFSQKIHKEGDEPAWELARKMATLVTTAMTVIVALGILLAPVIVPLMNFGWVTGEDFEKVEFTVLLSRIIFAFIAFVSLAALVMGMLNSKGVFFMPALASSFFNLGSIVSGAIIGYLIDPEFGKGALIGFAVGVLIGGLCQLVVQLPSLAGVGFKFRPDFGWNDPAVKKVLTLMVPATISGGTVQAGVALNTFFASFLAHGSLTYLIWAMRLMMLPVGVFGVAVATVTLPAASRASADGITEAFRNIVARGLRLVTLLTIPSALGLFLLAEPIISVIFERGRFTLGDTVATASALRFYAVGLVFYSAMKVIQPTFYAIGRKWIPMCVSLGAILINATLNYLWVFVFNFGHEFLALSTAIGSMFNFCVLYWLMQRYAGSLRSRQFAITLFRQIVSGLAMFLTIVFCDYFVLKGLDWFDLNYLWKIITLIATIGLAAASYFVVARLMNVEELDEFVTLMRRKVTR